MSLGLRAVPASMPHPHRWPVDELPGPDPGGLQQPLPWLSSQQTATQAGAPRPMRAPADAIARVRVTTTGEGWSEQPPSGLPDPVASAVRLAYVFLETLHGLRPAGQLNRWLDDRVLSVISAAASARRRTAARRTGRLWSVHLQRPAAPVVEAVALFRSCGREQAMAFRLEARAEHWLCTAWQTHPGRGG